MKPDPLKKKLAVLKSAPVPKGYWDNYWPRLKMKIEACEPATVPQDGTIVLRRWTIPVFALALVGVVSFYWGQKESPMPRRPDAPMLLVSDPAPNAQRVFREMLTLFPNRVNWISFVEGKVDFSISSVAYKDAQPLVPMVISLAQGSNVQHFQLLVRPGQDAILHAPLSKEEFVDITLRLSAATGKSTLALKVSNEKESASLEATTLLKEGESVLLGSLRWKGQLTQIHFARARKENPQEKKVEKHEAI